MGKTWPHLFNVTSVVLILLLGKQLAFVSSCSHAHLPASPASVYLLVKLINWFGTRLACAARPKGRVSGVLMVGSGLQVSQGSEALSEPAGQNGGSRGRGGPHWQGL